MMRKVKDLRGYAIRATDGVIGRVDDFYFDDEHWGIRYLVVDTGTWLSGRKVLICVGGANTQTGFQGATSAANRGGCATQPRRSRYDCAF